MDLSSLTPQPQDVAGNLSPRIGPCSRVDDGEDAANFGTLPRAAWLSSEAVGTLCLALLFFFVKNSTRA